MSRPPSSPSARRSRCKRASRPTSRNRSAAATPSSSTATCSASTARTPTRSAWRRRPNRPAAAAGPVTQEQLEKEIWEALKTCYDPEIPVNIVDLGLIYDCHLTPAGENSFKADVKMTLTAPGCGMGPMLAQDVQNKVLSLEADGRGERRAGLGPAVEPGHDDRGGQAATGFAVISTTDGHGLTRIRTRSVRVAAIRLRGRATVDFESVSIRVYPWLNF